MSEQGLRAVIGDLIDHIEAFGAPPMGPQRAAFIDKAGDRLLRASGLHKERALWADLAGSMRGHAEHYDCDFPPCAKLNALLASQP